MGGYGWRPGRPDEFFFSGSLPVLSEVSIPRVQVWDQGTLGSGTACAMLGAWPHFFSRFSEGEIERSEPFYERALTLLDGAR